MAANELSDKGLSIFTFAAYHQLESGERVREIVLDDGKGHAADRKGLQELEDGEMIEPGSGERGMLTDAGEVKLDAIVAAIRGA
ncbi:hypothetical protein [Pararhizobium mangrovi]|uniref:Uncharacterized protein n=1 Tax=Pararhizobium mangrovi TaxID=2590452 RepID=A0A506TYX2_9HYPH|nr:hypothetical protein [Pararhizobium mangrovi]TPW25924.1 hypothetical protein FJU11_17095 [Pararhizobium mangrovi]